MSRMWWRRGRGGALCAIMEGGVGGKIQSEHIPNHPANNGNGKMREKVGTRRIRDEQHKSQNAETRTRWRAYNRTAVQI